FCTVVGDVLDFYIFWKLRTWRTPPSLRQLFYPLVILSVPSHPFPSTQFSPIHPITHPTFIQISSLTPLTLLIPYYPLLPPILTLHLSTTHTQLIHSFSTGYPQPPILLIDLLSSPLFPLILLFLQSSPLYFLFNSHP